MTESNRKSVNNPHLKKSNDTVASESAKGDHGRVPRYRCIALSCLGLSHEVLGEACQDRSIARHHQDDTIILIAADGAGSAQFGGEGAQAALEGATESIVSRIAEFVTGQQDHCAKSVNQVFIDARNAVQEVAHKKETTLRACATTLSFAICSSNLCILAQVGDSVGVILRENGIEHAMIPKRSEFINETTFVTSDNWMDVLQVVHSEGPWQMVSLQTDGLQYVTLKQEKVFEPFYQAVYKLVTTADSEEIAKAELRNQLDQHDLRVKCNDDITLAIAVRF